MRIRELREDRGLHQKEVAAVLGVSQSSYCDLENGHKTFTAVELDKLANFYDLTLDEFLHGGKAVLHMHDHSSHGFNAYHMEHQHGVSEETLKIIMEALSGITSALGQLSDQQSRYFEKTTGK